MQSDTHLFFLALIKGKHDTWLARGLTTYKYENARLDKNLHQSIFFILARRNN
jgi:hypothetical protein